MVTDNDRLYGGDHKFPKPKADWCQGIIKVVIPAASQSGSARISFRTMNFKQFDLTRSNLSRQTDGGQVSPLEADKTVSRPKRNHPMAIRIFCIGTIQSVHIFENHYICYLNIRRLKKRTKGDKNNRNYDGERSSKWECSPTYTCFKTKALDDFSSNKKRL